MEEESGSVSQIIFIRHLPRDLNETGIKRIFSEYGTVKNIQLSRAPKSHKSRGYCWIKYETAEMAQAAVARMNGYRFDGNPIECKLNIDDDINEKLFKVHVKKENGTAAPRRERKPPTKLEVALRLAQQEKNIKAELAAKGIDYTWPSIYERLESAGVTIPDRKTVENK